MALGDVNLGSTSWSRRGFPQLDVLQKFDYQFE
jgi:hypothetical protein